MTNKDGIDKQRAELTEMVLNVLAAVDGAAQRALLVCHDAAVVLSIGIGKGYSLKELAEQFAILLQEIDRGEYSHIMTMPARFQ